MLRNKFLIVTFLMGMAVVFSLVLTCSAVDQDLPSKLPGDWQVDVEKTTEALKKADFDEDEIKRFTAQVGLIRLTFLKEMRLVVRLPGEDNRELKGTTKVQQVDEEKKLIKLLVTPELENAPPETVFAITFLDDDTIVIVAGEEPPMTLKRVKPDKVNDDNQDKDK